MDASTPASYTAAKSPLKVEASVTLICSDFKWFVASYCRPLLKRTRGLMLCNRQSEQTIALRWGVMNKNKMVAGAE